MTDFEKCKVENQHAIPCKFLASVLESDTRKKGLSILQFTNEQGKHTRSMVTAKSGKYASNGMILNFCPFCGANISSHIAKHDGNEEGR